MAQSSKNPQPGADSDTPVDQSTDTQPGEQDQLALVGPPKPAAIAAIGDSLIADMPPPMENAIAQHEEKEKEKRSAGERASALASGRTDRHGNTFDPAIHMFDETTGDPLLTRSGKLRININRPRGARNASKVSTPNVPAATVTDQDKRQAARATGIAAANSVIMLGVTIGGEEWQPIKNDEHGIDERTHLEMAFADYFEATGRTDFPPGVSLSIALVGYAAPRFTMPKTQSRAKRLGFYIKEKIGEHKRRKAHKTGKTRIENERQHEKPEDSAQVAQ